MKNFVDKLFPPADATGREKRVANVHKALAVVAVVAFLSMFLSPSATFAVVLAVSAVIWGRYPSLWEVLYDVYGNNLLWIVLSFVSALGAAGNFSVICLYLFTDVFFPWVDLFILIPTHIYMMYGIARFTIKAYVGKE